MRIRKQAPLTGEAPFCPIELSDVVVAIGHLGWATPRQDRYEIRRTAWWKWPILLLWGWFIRWQLPHNERVKRFFEVEHWLEASIDETGGHRVLTLRGRAGLRDRRKIERLCESLARGRRWLTPDAMVAEQGGEGADQVAAGAQA